MVVKMFKMTENFFDKTLSYNFLHEFTNVKPITTHTPQVCENNPTTISSTESVAICDVTYSFMGEGMRSLISLISLTLKS